MEFFRRRCARLHVLADHAKVAFVDPHENGVSDLVEVGSANARTLRIAHIATTGHVAERRTIGHRHLILQSSGLRASFPKRSPRQTAIADTKGRGPIGMRRPGPAAV